MFKYIEDISTIRILVHKNVYVINGLREYLNQSKEYFTRSQYKLYYQEISLPL